MEGLLDRDFAKKQQESSTYSPQSFNREYEYLYSINLVNCWDILRVSILQRN